MIHHSETIRCLIEREKVIHQVFGFFLLGQDFVHIGKKGVFDAVIVVVVCQLCQFTFYGFVMLQLHGRFRAFRLHISGQSPIIIVLAALVIDLAQQLIDSGGSLVIYGGGRLQLFFLALLLHSGVVGKVEDEVTEERGLGHDDFYQDIHVGKYTEVHGVIADTSTGDGIDLYVGFQEAQGRELLNDDFLPGTADTGFFLYTRLGVMERLVFKRNLLYCKPVEQNQLVGSQTVVK